jgi:hypothetical protein
LITGVIEAKEERDVMTCNVPNAFIQAYLPKKEPGEDRVVMKITGVLVGMLIDINPELYGPAIVKENQKKVIYVEVLKAIHGMLEAALLLLRPNGRSAFMAAPPGSVGSWPSLNAAAY